MKWVAATRNPDKLKEIRAIFADFPVELLSMEAFPAFEPAEESGTTLQANALLKARAIHRQSGLPAIADDTGLEVDALNGAPGVYAARYAGPQATYGENVEKLLGAMKDVPDEQRTARFRTCAAYVDETQEVTAEGVVEGRITLESMGSNGFGYDPVFQVRGTRQTFGQMTDKQKQQISHRARAFQALHQNLSRLLSLKPTKETPA